MLHVAVLDTNVLISALLSLRGNPFRCAALAKLGEVQSVTCKELLDEFADKLRGKLGFPEENAQTAREEVRRFSRSVTTGTCELQTLWDDATITWHFLQRPHRGSARWGRKCEVIFTRSLCPSWYSPPIKQEAREPV